jgi:uncharacterized protein (DUF1810 family)
MNDLYDLERFVLAQDVGDTFVAAVGELRAGRKVGHWMWFVFPQICGLGMSPISRRYAISSLEEARRYLAHPVLGPRLEECTRILTGLDDRTAQDIFGSTDAMKLRSSMTLFARANPANPLFGEILDRYFGGHADDATDARLSLGARPLENEGPASSSPSPNQSRA